jgi:ferredoxin-NADP reductase
VFLAGGAGITPFLAIFRDLYAKGEVGSNQLFFSNRTIADIILKNELEQILGDHFFNLISGENAEGYYHGRIDKDFLQTHITNFDQPFYICGPDAFTESILKALEELGVSADALVFEK